MNCHICHKKFAGFPNAAKVCSKHETLIVHFFLKEKLDFIQFCLPDPYRTYRFTYYVEANFLSICHNGTIFYRAAPPSNFNYENAPHLLKKLLNLIAFL